MLFWVYTRWDDQIGTFYDWDDTAHAEDLLAASDTVTIITPSVTLQSGVRLDKGHRLLWLDEQGLWHEHIVGKVSAIDSESLTYTIYAENSLVELNGEYIEERNSYGFPSSTALMRLIEDTRWELGKVDTLGTANIKYYHESVYQGLGEFLEKFGGEISTTITVGATGVTSRKLNHHSRVGSTIGKLFTYGYNMSELDRYVELDDVYTLLHCFGKGEITYDDDGNPSGNGRRITFKDINGGKDYICDDSLVDRYGIMGKNGPKHNEGTAIFEDCEDPQELLKLGRQRFSEVSKPRVVYQATVSFLSDAGYDFHNAGLGDDVYIRDEPLDERLTGRILKIIRHYPVTELTQIELGNITRRITDLVGRQNQALKALQERSGNWDGAASANAGWLDQMIENLNEAMNALGGYVYWEQGQGITVYDKPIDQNPTMAIQLRGGAFRIANSKKPDGDWDWRTFGTGNGFTADVLNAGTIKGGANTWNLNTGDLQFKQGGIFDEKGKNFWNLDTGEFSLSAQATKVDGKNIGEFAQDEADESFKNKSQDDIFQKLTDGGKTQGVYLKDSLLYINANYLATGTIKSADGKSFWNLNESKFHLENGEIVINGPQGTKVVINATDGFRVYKGSTIVAGTTFEGSNAYFYSDRLGRGNTYLYVGDDPDTPYGAMGYKQNGSDAIKFQPYALNGQRGGLNVLVNGQQIARIPTVGNDGAGLWLMNKNQRGGDLTIAGGHASFTGGSLDVTSDRISFYPTGYGVEKGGFSIGSNDGYIANLSGYPKIKWNQSGLYLYFSATVYIRLTASDIQFRIGSKGFGWLNGKFESELTWS